MDQTFDKRKKVILDFISDDLYVPMERSLCQREENTVKDMLYI